MSQGKQITWPQGNTLILDVVAPLDYGDPAVPVVMDAADTIQGFVFDKRSPLRVTALAAASQDTLKLEDTSKINDSDLIYLRHQDGTYAVYIVDSLTDATTLVITSTFADEVRAGTFIKLCVVGAFPVMGAAYGIGDETVASEDWGYIVQFSEVDVFDLKEGELLEGYIRLEKSSTGAVYSQSWDVIVGTAKGTP